MLADQAVGQSHTAGGDSQQHHPRRIGAVQSGLFDDLMRDARNSATHVGRRHQFAAGGGVTRGTHARS